MTKSLIKNTFREIKNTKARFISIMAIIALGVGFFAGIKATVPSMYNLARTYTDEQELMDYRLVSTVGFDEDDIKAVKNTDGVTSVMPSYFCDVQTDADSGGRTMRVIALPEKYGDNSVQNELVLTEGRLPEKSGEIAADSSSFTAEGYKIGDKIRFAKQTGDTDTSTELKTLEYTVVGLSLVDNLDRKAVTPVLSHLFKIGGFILYGIIIIVRVCQEFIRNIGFYIKLRVAFKGKIFGANVEIIRDFSVADRRSSSLICYVKR